jgi:squalene cyclase
MINWKTILQESPINWLLEKENPSTRYFTLRDILDKDENNPEAAEAKQAILQSPVVKKILQKQTPNGNWEDPTSPYHPKYKSTYWQIMLLAQLGTDKTNPSIKKACEYAFTLQQPEGGFSSATLEQALKEYEIQQKKGKKLPQPQEFAASLVHEHQYSCLTGNMTAAFIRIGYKQDPRVKKALEWLMKIQNQDGGWLCPYWRAHTRDKHGCFYGTICPLEAFSEIDKKHLAKQMQDTIEKGAKFMLIHHLYKADHHDYKIINPNWLTLSFPFFYTYNILRGLDVLTRLGYSKDKRLEDATRILLQKRQKDGKWILENAPTGRMHTNIENKGQPSKWITLIALRTLKRIGTSSTTNHS